MPTAISSTARLGTQAAMVQPLVAAASATNSEQKSAPSLVDKLIDSELEWRQLIKEANGGASSLSGLSELQLKRQEVIHELVQTERHHCLTLALMRQVYLSGLRRLNESRSGTQRANSAASESTEAASNSAHSFTVVSCKQQNLNSSLIKSTLALSNSGNQQQQQQQLDHQQQQQQQQLQCPSAVPAGDLVDLERLFPALEDLIQAHELFFAHLRLRLVDSCRPDPSNAPGQKRLLGLVGRLGHLLCDQFSLYRRQPDATLAPTCGDGLASSTAIQATGALSCGAQVKASGAPATTAPANQLGNGHKLLQAYAKFCGQHYDSSRYYKHLMQCDKGFKQFIEACNKQYAACRQRGIPECNLLVAQRLTKYPLLIEQLIKTSKDDPDEEAKLMVALGECKALLAELNQQLARKESFERLLDIYAHFCPKSYTLYGRRLKFTKHDLLQHKRLRQLVHSDGQIRIWSATRRKLFQVLCLILNDIIVFLRIESASSSSSLNVAPAALQHLYLYQHHLMAPGGDWSLEGNHQASLTSSDSHHHHHNHQPLSQCALINAVANAFQSSSSSGHHHHNSASSYQSPISAPLSSLAPTTPNNAHYQQHYGSSTNGCAASSVGSGTSGCTNSNSGNSSSNGNASSGLSVKYYFANIDNKSSVISLSKLLIREKAIKDGEPRIYLISSNPRQPEMYELAFVSKRHQVSFVDKLKSAIEQHNKLLERGELFVGDEQLELLHDLNYDEEEEEEKEEQGNCCGAIVGDDVRGEDEISGAGVSGDDANFSNDDDEEDDDDDDVAVAFSTPQCAGCYCRGQCRRASSSKATADAERTLLASNSTTKDSRTITTNQGRLTNTLDFEFELDIEQDVVPEPRSFEHHEPASFDYSTPTSCEKGRCCTLAEHKHTGVAPPGAGKSLVVFASCSGGSSCGTQSATSDADECLPGTSNESGLSERAKDSMDESAPGKQKLRGARRRRAQRPRNISNQSSSSSEAAHRQAIHMITCSAAAAAVAARVARPACKAQATAAAGGPTEFDEEFDSGRGHDDSSSAASTSSNSLGSPKSRPHTEADAPESAGVCCAGTQEKCCNSVACGDQEQARQQQHRSLKLQNSASKKERKSPKGSLSMTANDDATTTISIVTDKPAASASNSQVGLNVSCGGSGSGGCSKKATTTAETALAASSAGSLLKCSSILCKSNCPLMKQRKLSSVSTMSSQVKLLNRLKCGLTSAVADAGQQQQQRFCTNCNVSTGGGGSRSQQSTMSKQMRQQMRRSSFIPEQKLEELRDLRIQLDKDKQEWQAKFDKMQEQLLNERRELDLAREKLKQDRRQVANEREQLYRKLDVLKEKGILLSPSHKVIITTPKLRVDQDQNNHLNYYQHNLSANAPLMSNHQRAALQQINTNSFHYHQQQQQQQQARLVQLQPQSINNISSSSQYHHQQQFNNNNSLHVNHQQQANVPNANEHHHSHHQQQASGLFVQSTTVANKVPLHLANESVSSINNSSNRWPSLGAPIISKVPLIGSLSASLLSDRLSASNPFGSKVAAQSNIESHLI